MSGKWEPIATAPADGSETLVARFQGLQRTWVNLGAFVRIEGKRHWYKTKGGGCYPTHWLPFPEPPEALSQALGEGQP